MGTKMPPARLSFQKQSRMFWSQDTQLPVPTTSEEVLDQRTDPNCADKVGCEGKSYVRQENWYRKGQDLVCLHGDDNGFSGSNRTLFMVVKKVHVAFG